MDGVELMSCRLKARGLSIGEVSVEDTERLVGGGGVTCCSCGKAWDCSGKGRGFMWSAGPGTPNHCQPLDAQGLLLYNQQVPRTREIKTGLHTALERGRRELYVRLSGIMGEETIQSSRCESKLAVMTFA
jgi:hypothetical protein